jgi:hypothetical protein
MDGWCILHNIFLHYVLVPQLIINLPIAEGSKLVPEVLNIGVHPVGWPQNQKMGVVCMVQLLASMQLTCAG